MNWISEAVSKVFVDLTLQKPSSISFRFSLLKDRNEMPNWDISREENK